METQHMHHQGLTVLQVLKHNKKIRTAIVILVIATALGALFVFKGSFIAATVNGSPISRQALIKELEKQNGKTVLDTMISEKIIENEASKNNITITNAEIDQEIKVIEGGVTSQGGTLDMALLQQGMTVDDLKERIRTQKMVEKLLSDKIKVTDMDVNTYITTNKISLPKDKEVDARKQIADQLRDQKLNIEAKKMISELKAKAKINYYITY